MFVCTYIYMYVWVYTAEANAKRIREHYLKAVLRQDIAFFDNVGAGEVATRIQTDTREISHVTHYTTCSYCPYFYRFGPAGYLGKSRVVCYVSGRFRCWVHHCIHSLLEISAPADVNSALHCNHCYPYEQGSIQVYAVSPLATIPGHSSPNLSPQAITQACRKWWIRR